MRSKKTNSDKETLKEARRILKDSERLVREADIAMAKIETLAWVAKLLTVNQEQEGGEMISKKEENCVGCEFHSRCARAIFGHIGASGHASAVKSGIEKKKWCHNWQEFDKQKGRNE